MGPARNAQKGRATGRIALLILGVATGWLAACGGSEDPTTPAETRDPLTETLETADITFHFASGDSVNAEWQQAFHQWATALLEVSPPARVQYYKYRSAAEAREASGADYRSWADVSTFSIHTPDRQHGHEAIHLYTSLIGWPPDYFLEGLAVGLSLDPFTGAGPFYVNITDDNAHSLSRSSLLQGSLIPIESIVESDTFWTRSETVTYPQAGSFVNFIFNEFGVEKLRTLTSTLSHSASKQTIASAFETIYGVPLSEAERRWHSFLREWAE